MPAKKKSQPEVAAPARRRGVVSAEWDKLESEILKTRGEGVVYSASNIPPACHIPTGAFTLDFGLLGGVAEGVASMLVGKESSGKTTMALRIVAEHQRKHPTQLAVWVDTESMFDREWARANGCDLSRIKLVQPDTGEEAVDLIEAAMGVMEVGIIVLDSIPGCVPKAVVDRSAEDKTWAALAALMGVLCSKILMAWSRERRRGHKITFIPINQFRDSMQMHGSPNKTPGGKQINHFPTTKIAIRNKPTMGKDRFDNEVTEFNEHSFKLEKTKHGSSIKQGEFQMIMNPDNEHGLPAQSFDDYKTVITFSKKFGLLAGSGGKYRLPLFCGDMTWAKYDDIYNYLREDQATYNRVKASLIAMQRMIKGLPALPPDGYLCAPGVKVIVTQLKALVDAGQADLSE